MEESLNRELRRATRSGLSFGVMMLDVDHLKRFNDDALYSAKAAGRDQVKTAGHSTDRQMLRLILDGQQDLLSAKPASIVLAELIVFASGICAQGFSKTVENLIPELPLRESPSEIVSALAAALTRNISALEGDLLRKALQEAILEAAGLGYDLQSFDIVSGLQEFFQRRNVHDLIELFLSRYVFAVVSFKIQTAVGLQAQTEESMIVSMLALERLCRNIVRSVSRDLWLPTKMDQLPGDHRLGETIVQTIEDRLLKEGVPDSSSNVA